MQIGSRTIGLSSQTFIIAEMSGNNQLLERALIISEVCPRLMGIRSCAEYSG